MKDRKIHGKSNMWTAAQRQKNIYGFDVHAGFEANDRLAMASSVCRDGHMLRREDNYILKSALDFEFEGQRKKDNPKWT